MKQKDIIQLSVAIVIFVVAGYIIYTQLAPKKSASSATKSYEVEVVQPLQPDYDQNIVDKVTNSSIAKDFYSPPDLHSGIGNSQPFNPVK